MVRCEKSAAEVERPACEPRQLFVVKKRLEVRFHWFSPGFRAVLKEADFEPARKLLVFHGVLTEIMTDKQVMDDLYQEILGLPLSPGTVWELLRRSGPGGVFDPAGSNMFPIRLPDETIGTGNAWFRPRKGWCIGVAPVSDTHVWVKDTRIATHGIR